MSQELIKQMHAEDGCDGETLAECIQQLRDQRDGNRYASDRALAEGVDALQAHVAALRAALEPYHVAFPEAGVVDGANGIIWDEDADNLMEHGEDLVRVGDMAAAALAATPEQSLAALRAEAAAEALENVANLIRQTTPPAASTDERGEYGRGSQWGREYAIEQIEDAAQRLWEAVR